MGMSVGMLSDFVEATAAELGIPGVAVGVWSAGREIYACHGVTSVESASIGRYGTLIGAPTPN
jgi:hypothetical protein